MARLLKPSGGAVYLDGVALSRMSTGAIAREIAIRPGPVAPAGLTVGELVEQGRYPHAGAAPGKLASRTTRGYPRGDGVDRHDGFRSQAAR